MAPEDHQQGEAYLGNPGHCPYCRSGDITGGSVDVEGAETCQVVCSSRHRAWRDIYGLRDVEGSG